MMERKERKRRPTPPLSVKWLTLAAVRHLERWPSSERRIRELLWKRVKRAQSFHGGTREEAAPLVAESMQALIESGMVDDGRFATLWVSSLRRRGTSPRMIQQKLRNKGVAHEHIQAAISGYEDDDGEDAEMASARAYAKRRRLGPYRQPPDDSRERRRKDLAAMARAGFSYGVASDVLEPS